MLNPCSFAIKSARDYSAVKLRNQYSVAQNPRDFRGRKAERTFGLLPDLREVRRGLHGGAPEPTRRREASTGGKGLVPNTRDATGMEWEGEEQGRSIGAKNRGC